METQTFSISINCSHFMRQHRQEWVIKIFE